MNAARTATLGTIARDGRPRLVPICYALTATGPAAPEDESEPDVLYTPLDEKPKSTADPRALARVRDIERRADVTVLVDRWDEHWTRLAWLRCDGRAVLLEPPPPGGPRDDEHAAAVAALRARYPQYADHDLEGRPLIRIAIERVRTWGDLSDPGTGPGPSGGDSGSSSSPGDSHRR